MISRRLFLGGMVVGTGSAALVRSASLMKIVAPTIIVPSTYTAVTVDAKGRITSGYNSSSELDIGQPGQFLGVDQKGKLTWVDRVPLSSGDLISYVDLNQPHRNGIYTIGKHFSSRA